MNINPKTWIGLLAMFFCLIPATALAAELEVRWNDLSPLVIGRSVKIVLLDGCMVSGEATGIRQDVLAMDIEKSTNLNDHPAGMTAIPRAAISLIEVKESKGVGGRVLGTIVGLVVGVVAGGETILHGRQSEGGAVGTFTGVAVGSTVGGYFLGRSADQRTRIIRIVP